MQNDLAISNVANHDYLSRVYASTFLVLESKSGQPLFDTLHVISRNFKYRPSASQLERFVCLKNRAQLFLKSLSVSRYTSDDGGYLCVVVSAKEL